MFVMVCMVVGLLLFVKVVGEIIILSVRRVGSIWFWKDCVMMIIVLGN